MPIRSIASSAARTHASMFSASFRQGITTETSGRRLLGIRAGWRAVVSTAVLISAASAPGRAGRRGSRRYNAAQASGKWRSRDAARSSGTPLNSRADGKWRHSATMLADVADSGMMPGHAHLPRLRLPVPATPSAAPSAGIATSPSASRGDGHEVTYLTLRQWDARRAPDARRACASSRSGPRMALYTATGRRRDRCRRSCSAPACSGTCCATGAATTSSTPRSFPYFSLLAAGARAAAAAATGSSSTGTRSGARDYWREYLGGARRARSAARVQRLCARVPPARVLLLAAARASACARRACAARCTVLRGRVRGPARAARAARRPSRWSCSPGAMIPEKRAPRGGRRRSRARARADRRSCAARSSATAPSATRCCAAIAAHGLGGRRRARRASSTREALDARAARARCACCCPRGARATGWSSSRRPRAGTPSVVVAGAGQRGDRAGRGGRQRLRRAARRARRRSPRRSCASHEAGGALRERTARGSPRNARAAVARAARCDDRRSAQLRGARRARARSCRASAAPCAPR